MRHAGAVLLYTSRIDWMAWKYPSGGAYRSLFMELGHLSQTAYRVGTALELGMCFTSATRDQAIEEALGLDWTQEIFLGVIAAGIPEPSEGCPPRGDAGRRRDRFLLRRRLMGRTRAVTGPPLRTEIDLGRLDRNIRRFHEYAANAGVRMRSHIKGHLTVERRPGDRFGTDRLALP